MIKAGDRFPDFSLADRSGAIFDSKSARANGPLLIAFFKINCSACELTFPYLQRLADAYPKFALWGVSQNDPMDTAEFERLYGIRFPILFDADLSVSDSFDLDAVPSQYLADADGFVKRCAGGWSREFFDDLTHIAADSEGAPFQSVIAADDTAPDWKPG